MNFGAAGAAHCEKAIADYMAARDDWDVASLALSVNMLGFPLNEFYRRISYMVNTVSGSNTKRPVACITLFPFSGDFGKNFFQESWGGNPEEYRQKLRDAVKACPNPNVSLIEGPDILTDTTGLAAEDLIHAADNGMIEMGKNLGERLKNLLNKK